MSDLPDPLTTPEVDLRGYGFMPLFGNRLFQSNLYRRSVVTCPRAGLAAIKLWWCAWNQVPCGSLPDDEIELAVMADFGADVKGWRKCSALALQGFVKCSDGRLYHPILCDEAIPSFEKRLKADAKRTKDYKRLKDWREKRSRSDVSCGDETADETRFTDQNETNIQEQRSVSEPVRQLDSSSSLRSEPSSLRSEVGELAVSQPTKAPKRKTRLPGNWQPSSSERAYAENLELDVDATAETFRLHWLANGDTKADWTAAFQGWCRREKSWGVKRRGITPDPERTPQSRPRTAAQNADENARFLMDRMGVSR
ncbi:hypothetical protein M2305_000085 [Gluconobacter cerinus]|uniref:hypothetical protein n=1 Tax=Gluconobacter cerinus TaxID=38307 RepID=UPI002226C52C|nr:hypothetical protein [Gluconobacter cerinus]MCW2264138.1 hypothetical protein [Gluconobacter cerinus]